MNIHTIRSLVRRVLHEQGWPERTPFNVTTIDFQDLARDETFLVEIQVPNAGSTNAYFRTAIRTAAASLPANVLVQFDIQSPREV